MRMSKLKRVSLIIIMMVFIFPSLQNVLYAEDNSSQVKMTWAEFKKLLKLDSDEITLTLNEFKILTAQAGQNSTINYSVKNGKIVLPREQFKQLLNKMSPPESNILRPPSEYVINKAVYSGKTNKNNTEISAEFNLEIFRSKQNKYYQIPIIYNNAGITEILLNGKPALVTEKSGWYVLNTSKPGLHKVRIKYYIQSNINKGTQVFNLRVIKTAITLLKLRIPLKDIDVKIYGAKEVETSEEGNSTIINAVLPATNSINVSVFRKYKKTEDKTKKEPAKIYSKTVNLISIEDDALRVLSRVKLNILQNSIFNIKVKIPENYNILYIQRMNGVKIRDWQIEKTEKGNILNVPFDSPRQGNYSFDILSERLFDQEKNEIDFNGFKIIDSIRETGYIGAEKKSTAEAIPSKIEKLDRIDIKDLPYDLVSLSKRPLLFGFRYLRHPFNISMSITKHKELPTISTIIDMASLITVVLEDGKTLTKVSYKIRNTWKQFLKLKLPEDAEVWTVYVNNKRENVSKNKKGMTMIPLARSIQKNDILQSFNIDLIYFYKGNKFDTYGTKKLNFPTSDIMISKMLWSVYLPQDYTYLNFKGNVEKEELAKTMNLLFGTNRNFNLSYVKQYNEVAKNMERAPIKRQYMNKFEQSLQSTFKNSAINQRDLAQQIRQEANLNMNFQREQGKRLGQPGSGGNIFKIELPTTGKIFRFNRTIIEGEAIDISILYSNGTLIIVLKIVIIAILLFFIFLLRKKFYTSVKNVYTSIQNQKKIINFFRTKAGLRTILFVFAIIFFFISHTLFVIFVILFILAVFLPNVLLGYQSKDLKEKESKPEENKDAGK